MLNSKKFSFLTKELKSSKIYDENLSKISNIKIPIIREILNVGLKPDYVLRVPPNKEISLTANTPGLKNIIFKLIFTIQNQF